MNHFVKRAAKFQFVIAVLLALVCGGFSGTAFAVRHSAKQHHFGRHFRWLRFWNPMFRPSHESLIIQNAEIDRLDLPRIEDETELEALKADGSLLEIRSGEMLRFDPRLDPSRRYCRQWTLDFVDDLSQAYYHRFHQQISVHHLRHEEEAGRGVLPRQVGHPAQVPGGFRPRDVLRPHVAPGRRLARRRHRRCPPSPRERFASGCATAL